MTRINHTQLPLYVKEQTDIRQEFLDAVGAPEYTENPAWYDNFNVQHDSNIAVVTLGELRATSMPTVDRMLSGLHKAAGLRLSHFQMFVCRPDHCGMYHTDGVDRKASFNVPLFNCDTGGIDWTIDNPPGAYRFKSGFTTNVRTEERNLPVLDHMALDAIKLLRVDVWHRINNLGNPRHRVVFSMRFEGNPSFEKVVQAFRSEWRVL